MALRLCRDARPTPSRSDAEKSIPGSDAPKDPGGSDARRIIRGSEARYSRKDTLSSPVVKRFENHPSRRAAAD